MYVIEVIQEVQTPDDKTVRYRSRCKTNFIPRLGEWWYDHPAMMGRITSIGHQLEPSSSEFNFVHQIFLEANPFPIHNDKFKDFVYDEEKKELTKLDLTEG